MNTGFTTNCSKGIEAEYLEKINHGYLEYIKSQPGLKFLLIDAEGLDFVNSQQDYLKILNTIAGV